MTFDIKQAGKFLLDTSIHLDSRVAKEKRSRFDLFRSGNRFERFPLWNAGNLHLPADSDEAKQCIAIEGMLKDYSVAEGKKPISIAVFGPPGSGKSFNVKEIIKGIDGYAEPMVINLSQMSNEEELGLTLLERLAKPSEGIPAVFFDEFDASDLRWVKWFLSPMQDGQYVAAGKIQEIYKAVFVFAGGTVDRFEDLEARYADTFRKKKGPDFVSRLRGFLNVEGVNSRLEDRVLRRALILLFQLKMRSKRLCNTKLDTRQISKQLLVPLLKNAHFVHGNRSLEALLGMSSLSKAAEFTESELPENLKFRALHISYGPLDGVQLGVAAGDKGNAPKFFKKLAIEFLGRGADLVYGGDLRGQSKSTNSKGRRDGTLSKMIEVARRRTLSPLLPDRARIRNFICFPNHLERQTKKLVEKYTQATDVAEFIKLPVDTTITRKLKSQELENCYFEQSNAKKRAIWAISLFQMRLEISKSIDFLVVVGGKRSSKDGKPSTSWGRFSGIAEEVVLALALKKPVFILGLGNGAAAEIGSLVGLAEPDGNGYPVDKCLLAGKKKLKKHERRVLKKVRDAFKVPYLPKIPHDINGVRKYLMKKLPYKNSAWLRQNGLTLEQNRQLFNYKIDDADKCLELIARGIENVRNRKKK